MKYFLIGVALGILSIHLGHSITDWQTWAILLLGGFRLLGWIFREPRSKCCNAPFEQIEGYNRVKCSNCPNVYHTF